MPLTHAERQRRYREKLLQKHGKKVLQEKESKRKKEKREANIELARQKDRERKQRSRQKHSSAQAVAVTSSSPAYKSNSTLSKAVKRVQSALPNSPRKKAAVIKKLAMSIDTSDSSPEKKAGPTALSTEVENLVIQFYLRDDISRQAPGKRDSIVVKENGNKTTMQKRHLSMNIVEAHQLFKTDHPEISIGKSKFASLRPAHVLLSVRCHEMFVFVSNMKTLS